MEVFGKNVIGLNDAIEDLNKLDQVAAYDGIA